ncbi:hypothetical protein NDU88_003520 [Pleurodeles waltl]|uniref:Uncharacterized protein n=1 Tax=Pleurodeles waltl TaxID=8319 RepID=A0AAV7WPB1_PLEWA|nr:hypothetical protein NDU88_003520 [Pleurodeles waltl]
MAAIPVAGVVTELSTTTRDLPSEEVSESVLSPPVSAMVLPSPSVPLVPSASVDSASGVPWDAAPSVASASVPPPDDANAHKYRMAKQERGEHQHPSWRTQHLHTQGTGLRTMHCTTSDVASHQDMRRSTPRQLQHTWDPSSLDK